MNFNTVWCTGDPHGDFDWLKGWCEINHTTRDDALIILGDAGILYYGAKKTREKMLKKYLSECPITLICVRGNHENRASNYPNMNFVVVEDDPIVPSGYYFESECPNIWHVADGSTFTINGNRCLFIGGAYSVDKEYRQMMNWMWFPDEELTMSEMTHILDKVDHRHFDYIFTHTCPENWQPYDLFIRAVDQSKVSKRMEQFLTTVSEITDFYCWYFGHFHDDRLDIQYDKTHPGQGVVSMLYKNVERLM